VRLHRHRALLCPLQKQRPPIGARRAADFDRLNRQPRKGRQAHGRETRHVDLGLRPNRDRKRDPEHFAQSINHVRGGSRCSDDSGRWARDERNQSAGGPILVASMVTNSPFFWFFLPPLYAVGVLTGKISRWINSVSLSGRDGSQQGRGDHGSLAHA
jgi:hypothetical protein